VGPSSGAAPDGVTPIFPEELATFLVTTICQLSVLQYLFSPEKLTTFFFFWSSKFAGPLV